MVTTKPAPVRTILFDLDGTLLDTAPDLATALNHVLVQNGCKPLSHELIRPHVSHGAAALIRFGFDLEEDSPEFESLRQQLLTYYKEHIADSTRPFDGILELLDFIEKRGMNWGIVTNKPSWLTTPLLQALQLAERPACIVCGDTLTERKPHPAPMLHACELAGSLVHECIYIGDAERDIQAGQRAGMRTIIALFGYIASDQQPSLWGADAQFSDIPSIMNYIDEQNALTKP
jgi:phosphoglycolate phosphatase